MNEETVRLDVLVAKSRKGLTRSQAEKLINSGLVTVNGKPATKPATKVSDSAKLRVSLPKNIHKLTSDIPILYEDDDVVVIDKPAGLLTHSKGSFNEEDTVADWLAKHLKRTNKTNREGIVHRLDRATTGVLIAAKNEDAQKWLTKQFSTRKVKKTYIAVVSGLLTQKEAIIDMPIERNPKKPQQFRVGANGKTAQTAYKVLKEGSNTLLELSPKTGRTHQLRVHLASIGHPILGDTFYAGKPADRLYLHALSLELTLPNKNRLTFSSPLSSKFKEMVK